MSEKNNNPDKIGALKFFSWQGRAVSSGCNVVILGFLSIYCTNQLGLSPAMVGIILMVSRVIDAVTDLTAGYIIDRTHTKLGKGRPYEFCIILVWLCTWLLFSCPGGFTTTMKYIWVLVMYIFVQSIFNTLLNAAQTPYMVRAFNQNQMVRLASFGGITTMIGAMVVSISFPILMGSMATSAKGWSSMLAIYAIPLALIGILRFVFVKEDREIVETAAQRVSIRAIFKVLSKNPYIWLVAIAQMMQYTITNMGVGTYFYTYVVGDVKVMGMMTALGIVVLPIMFFIPRLMRRFTKGQLIATGTIIEAVGGLVMFLAGGSIPIIIVAAILNGIGILPLTYLVDLQVLDCADYNEWKGLPRLEGTLTSFRNFIQKLGTGLGAVLMGLVLEMTGFEGTLAVQGDGALMSIRALMGLFPMVAYIIVTVLMILYIRLDKQIPHIQEENQAKREQMKAQEEI